MNSNDSNLRRLAVALAVMCAFLVFGASGAQAASTHAVAASGPLAAQDSDEPSDEASEDNSDEEESTDDPDEDSDDEDSDDEDSDSEEPSDEPTPEPTFTDPNNDATDDITEMPTEDASETSEAGPSPLGWILLGGGIACAVAAVVVFRRNRGF